MERFKLMSALVIVLAALIIGFVASKMSPDNVVEEAAEEVIKEETGLDIDFSGKNKNENDEAKKQ